MAIPEQFNVASYFVDRHLGEGCTDRMAVLYREERLTYGQIHEQANRAANALRRHGVGKLDRVLILLYDSPAFIAAFWGAIKLGAVAVPANTLLTPEDYEFMLQDSGARCLVVQDSLFEKVTPALAKLSAAASPGSESEGRAAAVSTVFVAGPAQPAYGHAESTQTSLEGRNLPHTPAASLACRVLSFEHSLSQSSPEADAAPTHRDDPAFWLYTSGSTGRPKAAIHRHRDMVCCLESFAKGVLQISAEDRTFSASKLFFAYGLGNALYFPFGVGAQTVLLPERSSAERVFEVISRYRPTIFYGVPSLYAAMLQVPDITPYDLGSIRGAVSAGEGLPAPLLQRFRERFGISILDGIGSTEMLHMFISNRPGDIVPGSSGRLVPGYAAKIVDDEGNEVPRGEMGNLWVRGESAAAGYWNRPELTRATFRGGWTVTGDKYRCDQRGYYWYCGRSDDMLKVHGMWVSPVEVESALLGHSAVVECAVVGAIEEDGLEKPKAFVVLKKPLRLSAELEAELRGFIRDRLSKYKEPRWLVEVESLPKTATGKLQRFKLRERRS